jgi:thymidylate synthase
LSCDFAVGGAINVVSYSLLLKMIAQCVDMEPDEFIWSIGDAHIYLNQLDSVKEQLSREPLSQATMDINPEVTDIFKFKAEDFKLTHYEHHPAIKYEVAA